MITEHDLQEAIAECEGVRNPTANTCIKLAAFYTIQQHMFGEKDDSSPLQYSFAPKPTVEDKAESVVDYDGESEFLQVIHGKPAASVWAIIDELMSTLQVINPRLYDGVMRKIAE